MYRILLPALLAVLCAVLSSATAQAQSCSTRPVVLVNQAPSGQVDINATQDDAHPTNRLTRIDINADPHYVGSQSNVSIDLPGRQPGLTPQQIVQLTPAAQGYTFTLHSLVPGTAVTVPITIYDECGPYSTFVGAGAGVFTTALPTRTPTRPPAPTATAVRSPTIVPTPTVPVFPISTPLPATTVGYFPATVLQGNTLQLTWAGRPSPAISDYLVITTTAGVQIGPAIYTSSCRTTPGTIATGTGSCTVQLSTTLAPGSYVVKLFANGGSGLLAQKTGLTVAQSGGALLGRGQLWGTTFQSDDPDIAVAGGFVGAQGVLNPGDPAYQLPYAYNAVGVSSFGLIGDDFVESGSYKLCFPNGTCQAFPYMSWLDNLSDLQSVTWDGTGGAPNFPLPTNNAATFYTFKVFELAATRWTGEFCIPNFGCCPLWKLGDCSAVTASQINAAPVTLRVRYPWTWWGEETLSERWAAGVMHVHDPIYCCQVAQSQWTRLDCWDHLWDSFDHNVILTTLTSCAAPGIGWDAVTQYR